MVGRLYPIGRGGWQGAGRGSISPSLLPPVVPGGDLAAPVAVPGVAVAALGLDLGEAGFLHPVAAAEEGAVGVDLVEPGPQRRGARVGDDPPVAVDDRQADAGELRRLVPAGPGVDRADDVGARVL